MSEEKKRYFFIDQFRGWAVVFMIETHVVNAFLHYGLRSSLTYKALDFFNGLIAPSFLFIAGFSFGIVAERKWDDFLKPGRVFWKQCLRCLQILLIGYLLHVPQFSLRRLFHSLKWGHNHPFWGVDVLHAIAVSLLLMLLLIPLWRRKKSYFNFLAAAAVVVSLLTPLLRLLPIERILPWAFSGYLKRLPYSQFPLFPWMGFAFMGAAASSLWQKARQAGTEPRFFRHLLFAGFALVVIFLIIALQPLVPVALGSFNPAKPLFFFLKLGMIVMLLPLLWWVEQKKGERPVLVTRVGQESLTAYAFHIVVIFGGFFGLHGHNLVDLIRQTRSWAWVLAMAAVLILVTGALSLGWHWLKQNRPEMAKRVFWAGAFILVIYMILRV
ncbi:MAG: heparan-alpha-glucosaminide N-acetyltransferase domain-containing protein [Candidatus Aminicenantes bacterium]|nr:heparan-alpha-glucosaminide N-acetyltransferase domain-containing protein [Candidatus Aminicenantes bacterium]